MMKTGLCRAVASGPVGPVLLPPLMVGLALVLQGCVVVPQTREVYDPDCRVLARQMTLQTKVVGGFESCRGDACIALLTATGAVTAASAVVSGSIALAGNVVYWFEHQGQCGRLPAAAAEPDPAGAAGSSAAPQ